MHVFVAVPKICALLRLFSNSLVSTDGVDYKKAAGSVDQEKAKESVDTD